MHPVAIVVIVAAAAVFGFLGITALIRFGPVLDQFRALPETWMRAVATTQLLGAVILVVGIFYRPFGFVGAFLLLGSIAALSTDLDRSRTRGAVLRLMGLALVMVAAVVALALG